MIPIFEKVTKQPLGQISESQLKFLIDHLEEEDASDQDYYFNQDTIDYLEQQGADPALISVLTNALGSREELEIFWNR